MTIAVVFDKLAFMRRLEGEGQFSRKQAEAMSEAFHQAVNETVATKSDLAEVRGEITQLRTELRYGLDGLRSELKLWMGSLAAALFAALSGMAALMRFLGH